MSIALLSAVTVACAEIALSSAPAVSLAARASAAEQHAEPAPAPSLNDAIVNRPVRDPEGTERPLVFENETDEAVVEKVLEFIRGRDTMRGDFTQIAPSGEISSGAFHLRRPNQLRFEYAPPSPLLIVATQGNVYVRDNDLETTDFYPIKKTPLRFLLSRKVELGDARVVGVDRGVDTVAVTFASEEEETEGELSVILQAPDFALRQWAVRDVQNGITVVTLDNVTQGERFRNNIFRIPEAGGDFLKN